MDQIDRVNIKNTAWAILNLAYDSYIMAEKNPGNWSKQGAGQAYNHALEIMVCNHLIIDYCIPQKILTLK